MALGRNMALALGQKPAPKSAGASDKAGTGAGTGTLKHGPPSREMVNGRWEPMGTDGEWIMT